MNPSVEAQTLLMCVSTMEIDLGYNLIDTLLEEAPVTVMRFTSE